ncbi:MAG: [FeFe] hydrogenase H-cluster maturation GTPase HydF [Firmicutes bacterium]|nr:[FeFe] hydrogenase H-cluster maturation GTPase HydF [Bacillota bacterium]
MQTTPISNRLHIGIFGRRNAGKSSLLNSLAGQNVAVTSSQPGTTTDPVLKVMELIPYGPVVWIDTAGCDDEGEVGRLRVAKTFEVIGKTDLALIVISESGWGAMEAKLYREFTARKIPVLAVINQIDRLAPAQLGAIRASIPLEKTIEVSSLTGQGIEALKQLIITHAPEKFESPAIIGDLVSPGDFVVLVVPVDYEAPKGRLILPQVQVLRDLLDHGAIGVTLKETELAAALPKLPEPRLVITDSQAFKLVGQIVPPAIALTSFSILYARYKGDINTLAMGAAMIDHLAPGDRILIAETCAHHLAKDDIAREKLPRWLREYVGGDLEIHYVNGPDFPANIAKYRLIIHCGGCMLNRRGVLSRIETATGMGVPITNFGIAIAKLAGILPRALKVFNTVL